MNRSELVAAMALKTSSSKKAADESLRALIEIVSEELKNDGKVQLVGFGSFEVRKRISSFNIDLHLIFIPLFFAFSFNQLHKNSKAYTDVPPFPISPQVLLLSSVYCIIYL